MPKGLLVAEENGDENVVELRPGQDRDVLVCPRCGGDLWVAVVTIDRRTLRPTSVVGAGQPVIRCHHCARGFDPRRPSHRKDDDHDQ